MRVCLVLPYALEESAGGVSRVVMDISKELKHKDIQVTVIDKNVIFESKDNQSSIFNKLSCYLRYIRLLLSLRKKIDVLHVHTTFPTSTIGAIVGRIIGVPSITTTHGPFIPQDTNLRVRIYKLCEIVTFRFTNIITFVSKRSKEFYDIDGPVIYNGIDTSHYKMDNGLRDEKRNFYKINDKFVILFVGRVVKEKGIGIFLESISNLDPEMKKKIKILIVGQALKGEKDDLVKQIKDYGLEDIILNVGSVESTHPFYCAADLFCFPSIYLGEGCPIVLLEAMSSSIATISSDIGGAPELIKEGVNGFLMEPGNVKMLSEKIAWCVGNKDKLTSIGKEAETTMVSNFDIKLITDQYLCLYEDLTI